MILIIGASGAVGIPLVKVLVTRSSELKVLTSSEASAKNLNLLGVKETFVGDFRSIDDVNTVMKGTTSVCYIPARFKEDEFQTGKRIVDSARAEEVEHFCFCSAYHPQMELLGHHWQKLQVEEYLIESDLMYTVVQPSMFMQNLRVEWTRVINEGIYSRPYSPDARMNVIDTDDLGEAMAKIITDRTFWGATYELSGNGTLSHNEMAAIISEELGQKVTAVHRDIEEWKAWAIERDWTEYAIENYIRMCSHYNDHGYKFGNDITLQAILGRPATDYRTFVQKFIQQQVS